MKVLQIVHTFPPYSYGGVEKYTYQLSKGLSKKHEVHVLFPVTGNPRATVDDHEWDGLAIHAFRSETSIFSVSQWTRGLRYSNSFQNPKVEGKFVQLLSCIKPDIVHVQHLLNLSAGLIEITRNYGIPIVLTLHDYWFLCPTVHFFRRYNKTICAQPEPRICHKCWSYKRAGSLNCKWNHLAGEIAKHLFRWVTRPSEFEERNRRLLNLLNSVDRIIAPSQFLRNLYVRFGVNPNKMITLYHGYEDSWFSRRETIRPPMRPRENGITFGYIGRIVPIKGLHVLLEAFLRIPEENTELLIYGPYNPRSDYFRSLVKMVEGRSNIHFMGKTTDAYSVYTSIDVLVFPSIWFENCPLVLLERRLAGKPVIASNLGAIPEFVKNGVDGFLFRAGDVNDLYDKMLRFVRNPALAVQMSNSVDLYVKPMRQHVKEIERIYRSLLRKRNP